MTLVMLPLVLLSCGNGGPDSAVPPDSATLLDSASPLDLPRAGQAEDWPLRGGPRIGHVGPWSPVGLGPGAPPPSPPADAGLPAPSVAGRLVPDLVGGRFDPGVGTELVALVDALPAGRAELGVLGVDIVDLFGSTGDAGLCEDPRIMLDLALDGVDYQVALDVPAMFWMTEAPWRDRYALSLDCVDALLASPGDVDAAVNAGCTTEDEAAHFPDGSACRDCLAVDGDHARCLAEAACPETATHRLQVGNRWLSILRAETLVCAPDYTAPVMLLAEGLDEADPLPGLYDHRLAGLCVEVWKEAVDGTTIACTSTDGETGIGDVLLSRVAYIRPVGSTQEGWATRVSEVHSVEVEGKVFGLTYLAGSGATAISAPPGSSSDAWGLNPLDLRPGGTDPDNPDHTYAREYIAAIALKTATTREGVLINLVTHNRCPEDGWEGPHADGSYSCEQPGPWSTNGDADDGMIVFWGNGGVDFYAFPLVTLIATGLPDPSVPGGLLTHLLGSSTLADPEWEDCAWPQTFVPDRLRMFDEQPTTSDQPYASFDGQTWRFGKDPDLDIRVALATNQARGYCVEGL